MKIKVLMVVLSVLSVCAILFINVVPALASNDFYKDEIKNTLNVAATVILNAVTNITSTSVTLNAEVTSMGDEVEQDCYFEYGLTASYGSTATATPEHLSDAGTFSATITGLESGTTYHYRAQTLGGETVNTADSTFTTASVNVGSLLISALSKLIVVGLIIVGALKSKNMVATGMIMLVGVIIMVLVDALLLII